MDILQFLLVPIVGGIIGYTTNWLAIKMIFRPHSEKYFLGIKVPFTPGVIAKERKRIAKNVGTTLEKEVLTKEDLNNFLIKSKLSENIDTYIEEYLKNNSDLTLKVLLDNNFSINSEEEVKNKINSYIETYIESYEFKEISHNFLQKTFEYVLSDEKLLKLTKEIEKIFDELLSNVENYLNTEDFYKYICNKIDYNFEVLSNSEITIKESFENIDLEIKKHIKLNLKKYSDVTTNYLTTDSSIDFHIEVKKILEKMLRANLNPMLLGFVNIDNIYENAIEKLIEYLNDENNNA